MAEGCHWTPLTGVAGPSKPPSCGCHCKCTLLVVQFVRLSPYNWALPPSMSSPGGAPNPACPERPGKCPAAAAGRPGATGTATALAVLTRGLPVTELALDKPEERERASAGDPGGDRHDAAPGTAGRPARPSGDGAAQQADRDVERAGDRHG